MRASVYIAISLDGFIARENGGIDWLDGANGESTDTDYGYEAFMATVDVLVMGRNTFDQVEKFSQWPYGKKRVVVLTNRRLDPPAATVEARSGKPIDVIRDLSSEGVEQIYVDGGLTVQSFLRVGLIQQIIVTRLPILLGSGIPLFGPLDKDIALRHIETTSYSSGLVQSRYEVAA